ncbi:hypothetical protein Ancab_005738 [Ancistrocladus abbreviatus]
MLVNSSGFTCLPFSYNPTDYCLSSNAVTCRNHTKLHLSSLAVLCGNGRTTHFGISGFSLCRLGLVNRPKKMGNLVALNVLDRGTEDGLACEEDRKIPSVFSVGSDVRFHYLEERNEKVLSNRIVVLSRTNKTRSALELFKSMEFSGLKPDSHACNSILSCFLRNNMLEHALEVFKFMKMNTITSAHSYSLVLKAVANEWGSVAALRMFWEWEGDTKLKEDFDVIVYNTMISVCGKENDWVQMERLWNLMKKSGHHGTAVTYRILVCTFVRCGEYELAMDAYSEMLQVGLRTSEDAMRAIIGACTKEGKWDLALGVFESMLKSGLKPNLVACNTLINSLGKAGKVQAAFRVYSHTKVLGHSPDAYTWNSLLGALYKANQHAEALQLFDNIKKDQRSVLNIQLYNTALMCCQRLRLWDKALQLLWQMEVSGISVSTSSYNLVLGACEAARKPKIALQVYEHMIDQQCSPDTFTYLSLIRSCTWGSLWTELEEILHFTTPNVSLYNAAIHGMCLRGKTESAKRIYMKMRDFGLVPDGKTRVLMLQHLQKGPTGNL